MLRELNQRSSNGIDVALLWDDETDTVFIEVENAEDWKREEIDPDLAQDAFEHPFMYVSR